MKAYELAKELGEFMTEDGYTDLDKTIFKTANMLRQQASELDKVIPQLVKANGIIENLRIRIAELEKDLHMLQRHYDQLDHDTQGNYELILMDEYDVVVRMPIEEWQSIVAST
jgi:predicted transcriptional regulator